MAIRLDKTNLVRNLSKRYKLVPHLDREIAKGDFVWQFDYEPKKGDTGWHPSGDCTPTPYELYMKATGQAHERPFSGDLYKTFMVGHFWHQYIQWIVEKKLGLCQPEDIERRGSRVWREEDGKPVPFHWATGSGDMAPCRLPDGEFLVDIKTMGSHDFKRNGVPDWCAGKYEAQMNIYMDFFDLDRALILAVCKDSPHAFKEFEFERNQPLIDAIYHKWHLVSECISEGVTPPVDEDIFLPLRGPVA